MNIEERFEIIPDGYLEEFPYNNDELQYLNLRIFGIYGVPISYLINEKTANVYLSLIAKGFKDNDIVVEIIAPWKTTKYWLRIYRV